MDVEIPAWLNIDYTERILRLAEEDNTLQVIDIFTKPATNKGDNYTSDMFRVTVEFTRNQGEKKLQQKKSLIFKLEPIEEGPRKEMIEKTALFDAEIATLTDTVKKMNEMLGYEDRLSAQVYHVRMERPLCLVMEDLSLLGFRMADRQAGFDMDHALLAIRGLAKFHGTSVALCEKEPVKYKRMHNKGLYSNEYPEEFRIYIEATCNTLAEEVAKWPEFGPRYADAIKALVPHIYNKGVAVTKVKDNEFNVINHGDSWVNNMMFRYDENGKPVQHIFVDFQLCLYSSPAIDLHYFMASSLSDEVYANRTLLLDEYLRTLSSVMKRHNCKTSPPTMDELKRYLKERLHYELITSFVILPTLLTDKKDVKTIDELVTDHVMASPGIRSTHFRKRMIKRLPKYLEEGLLDP